MSFGMEKGGATLQARLAKPSTFFRRFWHFVKAGGYLLELAMQSVKFSRLRQAHNLIKVRRRLCDGYKIGDTLTIDFPLHRELSGKTSVNRELNMLAHDCICQFTEQV